MDRAKSSALIFYCNGARVEVSEPEPELSLAVYIREHLRLTGLKIACGQGGCGACTVMVSFVGPSGKDVRHVAVNACLLPLCSVHGMAVTTVEGLGNVTYGMHPVQERIAKFHGSQCGFCTPGMVMSMYALLRNHPKPSQHQIETVLAGNLCRCTGYRSILQGFSTFTEDFKCPMGENCCKNREDGKTFQAITIGDVPSNLTKYDPSQELIFPSELQINRALHEETAHFFGQRITWIRPTSLTSLRETTTTFKNSKLVAGNTALGLGSWFSPLSAIGERPIFVTVQMIPELQEKANSETGVTLGSALTLNEVHEYLNKVTTGTLDFKHRGLRALCDMIERFSGSQIRNVVTLGGNLASASPTSDINTVLAALGAFANVMHQDGSTTCIPLNDRYFQEYRKTALNSGDIIINVVVPFTKKNEYAFSYKQGRKRDNDASFVNACFRVELSDSNVITSLSVVYGGVAGTTFIARKTAEKLTGKPWNEEIIDLATCSLLEEINVPTGAPGGKEEYRCALVPSLFHRFFITVQQQIKNQNAIRLADLYPRSPCKGVQVITEVTSEEHGDDTVGRPIQHASANKQATGEAKYVDDIPHAEGELHMKLVLSCRAHAKITKLDSSAALAIPGVIACFSHEDVNPEHFIQNDISLSSDRIFAQHEATSDGHPIAAVVAISAEIAQRAARAVIVEYEDLPRIVTIQDAIDGKSYMAPERKLQLGDLENALKKADHVFEGQVHFSGQEHFYMEPQGCLVIPQGEDDELEIFSSTQFPSYLQAEIGKMLGVQANKIVVRVKRVGGAFGGKETKPVIPGFPAALAAHKLKRPIRCILSRSDDMVSTGARHSNRADYKVGCLNDGKIVAVEYQLYNNGGHNADVSPALMELTMFNCDNGYNFNNMHIRGQSLRSNTPSNTSCRGAGSFPGVFFAENLIHHVGCELGLDPTKVREMNLHKDGDVTQFGQTLENVTVKRCWGELISSADVEARKAKIQQFNLENKYKKRGLAVTSMKYGIGFPYTFLYQGGALVHIYLDGSVLLTHGATEVGQGIHTKMIQIAGRVLEISTGLIHISETCTKTVPNAVTTSASINSDIFGMAVLDACEKLKSRLKPFMDKNPEGKWTDWVNAAYNERVNLSASGFHKVPGISDVDWTTGKGNVFPYFSFGAACSEVEIDCLTGAHIILRTDVVIDVGQSLNPAIDVGQIEGGFVMGLGLVTCEERLFTPEGRLVTKGPINYKIPSCTDIPMEFNVSLLKEAPNKKAVYSSKGIGEPPMFLSLSVFFAIKEAIRAARSDHCLTGHFRLDSPATSESIRMACGDPLVQKAKERTDAMKISQEMRI